MIKIGFLINTMYGGGAERIVLYLLNNLDRRIFKPYLILFKCEGHYLQDILNDVEMIQLKSNGGIFDTFKLSNELCSIIKQHGLDIINSHMTNNNLSLLRASFFFSKNITSIIITEHSNFSKKLSPILYRRIIHLFQVKKLYKNTNIVCVSKGVKNDLIQTLSLSPINIDVVYNPVDFNKVSKLSFVDPVFIKKIDGGLNIVAVGRLEYVKGFDILIKAFRKVNQIIPNTRLYIIGDGSCKSELIELRNKLGLKDFIVFTGFTENPWAEIRAADLFVLSSRWEGFGNVIIEAMACETAVVSTNCDFGPSEIIKDKFNGRLVANENIATLADSIIDLLLDPEKRANYTENALESIMQFDLEPFLKRYSHIFQNAILNNRKS